MKCVPVSVICNLTNPSHVIGEASKVFLDSRVPQRRMVGKIGRTSRDYNEGWVVDAVPCIDTKGLCCCKGTEAVQTPPLY